MFYYPVYAVAEAACQQNCPVTPVVNESGWSVSLNAEQLSRLLAVGSGEAGGDGDHAHWADLAVEKVAARLECEDPWWVACQMVAESALQLDTVCTAALEGPLQFCMGPGFSTQVL
jgi:hypothetical protein